MGDGRIPCAVAGPPDAPAIVPLHANGWSRAMWRPQVVALAGEFRVIAPEYSGPVVILNGERDRRTREAEDEQAHAAHNAPIAIIRDAGHLANLDQPEAFNAAVRLFARQVATQARMRPDGVA